MLKKLTVNEKIKILERVIRRFERILPLFSSYGNYARNLLSGERFGICDSIHFVILRRVDWDSKRYGYILMSTYYKKEFMIRMPHNQGGDYKWGFEYKDYEARIRACKNAILRLKASKKIKK